MTTFSESTTGLGLILPEAAHTAWEGIAWQNQHLTGWVLEAQNRQTRLVSGELDESGTPHRLTNVSLRWVLDDGTHQEGVCSDLDISYDPASRKVYYVDFDQMDPGDPSKHLIQEMNLPNFADFAPSEKQFPLLHVGQYPHVTTGNTAFAKWVAPRLDTAQQMPVGTILMYDGTAWVDNQTMLGWYACTGGTVPNDGRPAAGQTIPDLVDRFVMGGSSSGTMGGQNAVTQILDHAHYFSGTTATFSSSTGSQQQGHSHQQLGNWANGASNNCLSVGPNSNSGVMGVIIPTNTGSDSNNHHHDMTHSHAFSGTTLFPGGSVPSIDNRPQFYTAIFIKRLA